MFSNPTEFLSTMLRITLFSMLFIGPVAGFAANHAGSGASMKGAGLVLFISLQRNR